MNAIKKSSRGIFFFLGLFISSLSTLSLSAAGQTFEPMVAHDFIKEAKHMFDGKHVQKKLLSESLSFLKSKDKKFDSAL